MEPWLIFVLISVVSVSISEITQKISLTQRINLSAITNNFYVWVLQGIIGLLLTIRFHQFSLDLSTTSILKLILMSVIYFLGSTFFYGSYKSNSPSISLILGTISVVISSVLGNLFLNEQYSYVIITGMFLILLAIVFVNIQKKTPIDKYNIYAILGGIFYGFAFTLDKSLVTEMSPFMYLSLMSLGIATVSLISSFKRIRKESHKLNIQHFYLILLSSLGFSIYNIFTFLAYKNGGNVGVIDAINNLSIFLVIILEIILLKDRKNLLKKILAALLAVAGLVLIAVGQ
jgi:drug/metabolite transporter (DMT)-like permease